MVESPCTSVCKIEAESGLCKGCKRTKKEIMAWMRSSDEYRKEVLNEVRCRNIESILKTAQ